MPCIDDRGQLNVVSRKILNAFTEPTTLEKAAEQTGLPLYRIRSGVREMAQAGLIEEKNGAYIATAAGRALLEAPHHS
jgi:predicted Rossmann fold nucleotide-binding protein DprA/Smf involved in DNA uptake